MSNWLKREGLFFSSLFCRAVIFQNSCATHAALYIFTQPREYVREKREEKRSSGGGVLIRWYIKPIMIGWCLFVFRASFKCVLIEFHCVSGWHGMQGWGIECEKKINNKNRLCSAAFYYYYAGPHQQRFFTFTLLIVINGLKAKCRAQKNGAQL